MTITPAGLLVWPEVAQIDGSETKVKIIARDARGNTAHQTFFLLIH